MPLKASRSLVEVSLDFRRRGVGGTFRAVLVLGCGADLLGRAGGGLTGCTGVRINRGGAPVGSWGRSVFRARRGLTIGFGTETTVGGGCIVTFAVVATLRVSGMLAVDSIGELAVYQPGDVTVSTGDGRLGSGFPEPTFQPLSSLTIALETSGIDGRGGKGLSSEAPFLGFLVNLRLIFSDFARRVVGDIAVSNAARDASRIPRLECFETVSGRSCRQLVHLLVKAQIATLQEFGVQLVSLQPVLSIFLCPHVE